MTKPAYINNNIEFRIVSAHAIAQFKQNQAFDLNELVNNVNFKFSKESREVMLLNYDLWFNLILKIERIFVKRGNKPINHDLADRIANMMEETLAEVNEVINENPTFFNVSAKRLITESNCIFKNYLQFVLHHKILDKTTFLAFPSLVVAISNSLNNLLFQLQEIEYLVESDMKTNAFISFTDQCRELTDSQVTKLLTAKAHAYYDCFNTSTFYIKNYTKNDISECIKNCFANTKYQISDIVECGQ